MCVWNNDLGGMCVECVYSARMCAKFLQSCLTLGTVAHQAPLSIGFSRQEYNMLY